MLIIGLTGGIGSGKTTVANMFAELGIAIVDADVVARELVQPETLAWQAIVAHFGSDIIGPDKSIQRQKLRERIFQHPADREWLEDLLHPQIRIRMQELLEAATSSYAIAVIPLLVENLPNPLVQRILVVDAVEDSQIKRVTLRDNLAPEHVRSAMLAQAKREHRLAAAHDVIENHGDLADLQQQVLQLHQKYLLL